MKNNNKKTVSQVRKEAKKHFDKIREIVQRTPSPLKGMTKEEVIEHMRKTREKLWSEKIGLGS